MTLCYNLEDEMKKKQQTQSAEMVDYLIDTVKEVIEVARQPVPVLDKAGHPTGATEYQAATVLKGCELLAKLLGTLKEPDDKPVSVQIVSYRDAEESDG